MASFDGRRAMSGYVKLPVAFHGGNDIICTITIVGSLCASKCYYPCYQCVTNVITKGETLLADILYVSCGVSVIVLL